MPALRALAIDTGLSVKVLCLANKLSIHLPTICMFKLSYSALSERTKHKHGEGNEARQSWSLTRGARRREPRSRLSAALRVLYRSQDRSKRKSTGAASFRSGGERERSYVKHANDVLAG